MPTQLTTWLGAVDGAIDRAAVAQVRLDEGDLADIAERLQEAGEIGTAHGDADAIAALGERPDDMPPTKPRPSEHGHERRQVGKGHGRLLERLCGMLIGFVLAESSATGRPITPSVCSM